MKRWGHVCSALVLLLLMVLLVGCDDSSGDTNCTSNCGEFDFRSSTDTSGASSSSGMSSSSSSGMMTSDTSSSGVDTSSSSGMMLPDTSDEDTAVSMMCGRGGLLGRVCAPNDVIWIGGASVRIEGVDCANGTSFSQSTTADPDGFYSFEDLPSGTHTITIEKGAFSASYDVRIFDGSTTDVTSGNAKTCLVDASVRMAVIGGQYDSIEGILSGLGFEMGRDFDFYDDNSGQAEAFLSSGSLNQYDIIFINCGDSWYFGDDWPYSGLAANLRSYVEQGGSLYVSDLAYFFIHQAYPNAIDFHGDEQDPYGTWSGAIGDVNGAVIDGVWEDVLGRSSILIDYPLQGWVFAESVAASTDIHVQGNAPLIAGGSAPNAGLLVSFRPTPTSGRVLFTSFHNESQLSADIARILQHVIFTLD